MAWKALLATDTNARREAGLEVMGYCNQAQFLVNCGITDVLAETPAEDVAAILVAELHGRAGETLLDVARYYGGYGMMAELPIPLSCSMDAYGIITRTDWLLSPAAKVLLAALRVAVPREEETQVVRRA